MRKDSLWPLQPGMLGSEAWLGTGFSSVRGGSAGGGGAEVRDGGGESWGHLCPSSSSEGTWKGHLGLGSTAEENLNLQVEDVLQSRVVGGVGTSEPLSAIRMQGPGPRQCLAEKGDLHPSE